MSSHDLNPLYLQMGDVVRGLRALSDTIELRHAQVEKLHDILRADLTVLRNDQSDLDEKLECVICVMQHDLERLRVDAVATGHAVDQLVRGIQELGRPVAEIVALRSRVAGLVLGLGVLGSAVMWLAEPLYRWFVEHNYLKQ